MSDRYVVIDDKKYPDRVYWNEAHNNTGNEIMNIEDANKVYKLVPVEELE